MAAPGSPCAQSTAITHAYALIKRIVQERGRDGFQVVITRPRTREEARAIFDNMRRVAREHLDVRLDYLGASLVPVTDNLAYALLQRLPAAVDGRGEAGFADSSGIQQELDGFAVTNRSNRDTWGAAAAVAAAEFRDSVV